MHPTTVVAAYLIVAVLIGFPGVAPIVRFVNWQAVEKDLERHLPIPSVLQSLFVVFVAQLFGAIPTLSMHMPRTPSLGDRIAFFLSTIGLYVISFTIAMTLALRAHIERTHVVAVLHFFYQAAMLTGFALLLPYLIAQVQSS